MSPKDSIVWVMRWQETTATLPIAFFFFFFFNIWIVRRVKGCHAGNSIPDTKFAYLPAENRGKQEFSQDYQRSLRSIAERSGFGAVTTIEAGFSARRDVKVCSPLVHTVATATVTKTIDRKKKTARREFATPQPSLCREHDTRRTLPKTPVARLFWGG